MTKEPRTVRQFFLDVLAIYIESKFAWVTGLTLILGVLSSIFLAGWCPAAIVASIFGFMAFVMSPFVSCEQCMREDQATYPIFWLGSLVIFWYCIAVKGIESPDTKVGKQPVSAPYERKLP